MVAFNNFYYNSGAGLSWFSIFVSNAITRIQPTRQIAVNPHRTYPQHWMVGSDIHEWDDGYTGFAYGRYLTYTNTSDNTDYPFWLGIYFEHTVIRFGIWFDTTTPAGQIIEQNLRQHYPQRICPGTKGTQRGIYVWWIDDATNDNLLDGTYQPAQCENAIYNFVDDVLNNI